jgi:hypothetical protein
MKSRNPTTWYRIRSVTLVASAAVVAFAVAAPRAEAQTTAFWVGTAGPDWNSVNWNTTSSSTANYTPLNGNNLRWGPLSAGGTSNNDFADLSVGSVSLDNAPADLVLNGNRLTLTGGLVPVALKTPPSGCP